MEEQLIDTYRHLIQTHASKLPLCLLLSEVQAIGTQAKQKTASLCEDEVVAGQVMKNRMVYKLPFVR